ncbi:hypothetical protein ACYSNS_14485, partial [Bartonella sp. LJL80]
MKLSGHPRLNRSVSCFAIAGSIGVLLVSSLSVSSARAEDVTYTGAAADVSKLLKDPTGDTTAATTYKSLYVNGVYTGNTITVDGGTGGNGQAQWNTGTSPSTPVAPYVIYGGVDVAVGVDATDGADIIGNYLTVKNVSYDWSGDANKASTGSANGAGGIGGFGGGSIVGGLSVGGAADFLSGDGGHAGDVKDNTVVVTNVEIWGAAGGDGHSTTENLGELTGGGVGGMGGASVFGGVSLGGVTTFNYSGGYAGSVTNNFVYLTGVKLIGGNAGSGGFGASYSAGGIGGMGGGSVYGALSIGGAAQDVKSGVVQGNTVKLDNVTLVGGKGGSGGDPLLDSYQQTNGGSGGMGGGSVFGGLALSGGAASSDVINNSVVVNDVILTGAAGGKGGRAGQNSNPGVDGQNGGSIFGGASVGGGAGDGGNVNGNEVSISGKSLIWGDVYGGYSHGGSKGNGTAAGYGTGGLAINNTVTLAGSDIKIGERDADGNVTTYGSIWGGRSVNGDGSENTAFDTVIKGNTLNLVGYRGTVFGIYNFENYNWTLPSDVKNGDTLVTIANGGNAVDLTNTKHTVAMVNDGNRLNGGDTVTMIDKTQGSLASQNYTIRQGSFIVYDATLAQQNTGNNALVLTINDKTDDTPSGGGDGGGGSNGGDTGGGNGGGGSAAKVNPQSKSYSEGRAAALGFVNQGSDLIATAGIDHIRIMVRS